MNTLLILLAPSANRVYAGAADGLAAAELQILLGDDQLVTEPITLAGIGYLRLDAEPDDRLRQALGRLSAFFAAYVRDHDHLLPFEVPRPDLFDDDLVTIPKYPGKTNEQFTRLLINVTLASMTRLPSGPLTILDPLCGRGTTLSTGLTLGHDVAGVDADLKALEAYAAYLRTYLRRKRLKHSAELSPVRREGRTIGRRLDVEIRPERGDRPLSLTVFSGDTRQSAALFGKRRFDAVIADAPYGVVHGSRTDVRGATGKRDRSVAGLIGEALHVWAGQLKTGARSACPGTPRSGSRAAHRTGRERRARSGRRRRVPAVRAPGRRLDPPRHPGGREAGQKSGRNCPDRCRDERVPFDAAVTDGQRAHRRM